jgi:hypothetical protein
LIEDMRAYGREWLFEVKAPGKVPAAA